MVGIFAKFPGKRRSKHFLVCLPFHLLLLLSLSLPLPPAPASITHFVAQSLASALFFAALLALRLWTPPPVLYHPRSRIVLMLFPRIPISKVALLDRNKLYQRWHFWRRHLTERRNVPPPGDRSVVVRSTLARVHTTQRAHPEGMCAFGEEVI